MSPAAHPAGTLVDELELVEVVDVVEGELDVVEVELAVLLVADVGPLDVPAELMDVGEPVEVPPVEELAVFVDSVLVEFVELTAVVPRPVELADPGATTRQSPPWHAKPGLQAPASRQTH